MSDAARFDRGTPRPRSGARLLAFAACLTFSAYLLGIGTGPSALNVPTRLAPADVIVVLGGDAIPRATGAGALFRAGYGARILVTGEGDCERNRTVLLAAGVPDWAIVVECASGSTWENAALSAPILAELRAQRVILVTTWWHMRRAVAAFRHVAPGVELMTAPVGERAGVWRAAFGGEGIHVTSEYLKLVWYAVRAAGTR